MYWSRKEIDEINSRDIKDDKLWKIIAILLIIFYIHLFIGLFK